MNEVDTGNFATSLAEELDEHYESLEKLYSIVMTEKYALEKNNLRIIEELSQAKQHLLNDISLKKDSLTRWYAQWTEPTTDGANIDTQLLGVPIAKIRNLTKEIIHIEGVNAQRIKNIDNTFLQHENRSDECGLKNLA